MDKDYHEGLYGLCLDASLPVTKRFAVIQHFVSPCMRKYYASIDEPLYIMETHIDNENDTAYSDFLLDKFLNMSLYERFTKQSKVYENFSKNPALTIETILNRPNENWVWAHVEKNTSINWDIVQQNRSLREWNIENLSYNPNITWDIVREFENESWSFSALSTNPNITCDIIEDFPQFDWNFNRMHENPNLTQEFIQNNIDKPFDFDQLSSHKNVSLDLVQDNIDKGWNIVDLGNNKAISFVDISDCVELFKPYEMHFYTFNTNVPWHCFYTIHPQFKLCHKYSMIEKNPHFTVGNMIHTYDPLNKLFGKFEFIEYMRNKSCHSWDLIDYAIASSRDGVPKENPKYDLFLELCADGGHVNKFKHSKKIPTSLFYEPHIMSNCPDTTFIEIEKYNTPKYTAMGKWDVSLARNPMPKYKELFNDSKLNELTI